MTQIQEEAEQAGWEAYSFYGRGEPSNSRCYKICNKFDVLWNVFLTRIFDRHGYGSKMATRRLIKRIQKINPDVIQLHNLHGYYLNLSILFEYLKKCDKKIIWTLHDCWAFTGHCVYFTMTNCQKWKKQCENCVQKRKYPNSILVDNSKNAYDKKKELFMNINKLTLITPSVWLANIVKESFLRDYEIKVIKNGIDLEIFKPTNTIDIKTKYNIDDRKKIVLGVAAIWDDRKGLDEFIELSKNINKDNYQIVIVGLNQKQIEKMPNTIIGIQRVDNIEELVNLYTTAHVLFNPSKEETFSLVTVEAMACNTPVIAYDNSAVKELITIDTKGLLLKNNSSKEERMDCILKYLDKCEKIDSDVVKQYSRENMTRNYINIYGE